MINGKAIYTPKGAALEYGRIGCNFYTGCPHNCEYCYLKRGAPGKLLGGTEVRLKKCFKDEQQALEIFRKEVNNHKADCLSDGIFFSFTTDPLIKETRWLTLDAIMYCINYDIPVYVLTKDATFSTDLSFGLRLMSIPEEKRHFVHFGFTLTGRDDMEPNASSNNKRMVAMRSMKGAGFSTFASIEPVIDWRSSVLVIVQTLGYCDHYKIGLRSGEKKDYYDSQEILRNVYTLKQYITMNGATVYFKESVRKRVKEILDTEAYSRFLKDTVDMDGNKIE